MNMNIMVIDCEYNQPSHKCIQIGAAVYEPRSGAMLAKFETYVNPGEPINPYITDLTGVRDSDVSNAPTIKEAYFMLKEFHKKHRCYTNPLVWGSGVRNDSQLIHQEAAVEEENFMGYRVLDVKTLYQSIKIFRNERVRANLKEACKSLGMEFEGTAHTALADAVNTFRVWYNLMHKFNKGFKDK